MSRSPASRRQFLSDVGRVMLVAGVGYSTASDLGIAPAWGDDSDPKRNRLSFGPRDRLVDLIQESPPEKLLPHIVELLRTGTDLKEVVAAAALANSRAFGGEDYIGFHTFMALMPAYQMSLEMPSETRALPVLKVLYRNAARLQESGKATDDVLKPVESAADSKVSDAERIRQAVHGRDAATGEATLAHADARSHEDAWNDLLPVVHEACEVHRIVLAHRAWDMLTLVGPEHALTTLRQSLRHCVKGEPASSKYYATVRWLLPNLLTQYKLDGAAIGTKAAEDAWVDNFSQLLFRQAPDQAADAVAAALAEGFAPDAIAEAISLAANQLVLRDSGRTKRDAQPNKPIGSVHGDSIGVHACDSANAWRNIAKASRPRNAFASLILSGYQVALDRIQRGGDFMNWLPRPTPEQLEPVASKDPQTLLSELDAAIRDKHQERACALAHRYCEQGHDVRGLFEKLRQYATSEDGALHAEKYYWTASSEYALARPAFRPRQLVALARVTASAYGTPAPGYDEACRLVAKS